jgi:hypothetical protein
MLPIFTTATNIPDLTLRGLVRWSGMELSGKGDAGLTSRMMFGLYALDIL